MLLLRLLRTKLLHRIVTNNNNNNPYGIPRTNAFSHIHHIMTPPNVVDASSSLTVYFLKNSCSLSSEAALTVAGKIQLKTTKKAHSVLALLKHFGFSKPNIARLIARRPRFLLASPNSTLRPKLEFYRDIGGLSGADLAKLLSAIPGLLLWSLEKRLLPNFNLLKTFVHTNKNVISAIRNAPRLLISNLPNVLLPKIESLKNYGMPLPVIFSLLTTHPKSLIEKTEHFEETFDAIKETGISPSTTIFAHAFGRSLSIHTACRRRTTR